MANRRFSFAKFSHRWHTKLMYVVGVQFLIWSVTGLYMVSMDIHDIHGDDRVSEPAELTIEKATYPLVSVIERYPDFSSIELTQVFNKPHFKVTRNSLKYQAKIIDAETGNEVPKLSAEQIIEIVSARVQPRAEILSVNLLDTTPPYVSSRFDTTYQVRFDTWDNLHFYVQAYTGEIYTKRHSLWHIFDWMWRFHIMDYDDGANIHHWFFQSVAIVSLIALTFGALLLWSRKRFTKQALIQSRPVYKHILTLHKWLALIAVLQIFVWLSSGLYLSLIKQPSFTPIPYAAFEWQEHFQSSDSFASLWESVALQGTNTDSINKEMISAKLLNYLGKPAVLFTFSEGYHRYFARDSLRLNISFGENASEVQNTHAETTKRDVAAFFDMASIPIDSIEYVPAGQSEIRGEMNALWKIKDAREAITYYIEFDTGVFVAQVNNAMRLHDLMLRLHFMDYFGAGHFNHVWNIVMAAMMVVLSISGFFFILRRMQQYFLRKRRG